MNSPAEQPPQEPEPSRMRQLGKVARRAWENRPSLTEFWYIYLPMGIIAAGLGTAIVDDAFNLELSETLAEVEVDADDNFLERFFKETVQEIGEAGLEFLEDD